MSQEVWLIEEVGSDTGRRGAVRIFGDRMLALIYAHNQARQSDEHVYYGETMGGHPLRSSTDRGVRECEYVLAGDKSWFIHRQYILG